MSMKPVLGSLTREAITKAILADGGAAFRVWQGRVIPHMSDAFRGEEETERTHLGASQIGNECARSIWYGFRWVGKDPIDYSAVMRPGEETPWDKQARMFRLWNRGHLEEARVIAMLLTIGCKVVQQDAQKRQLRFVAPNGHFAGSMDGIVIGIPDLPAGIRALLEVKTYNDKRFKDLVNNGVLNTAEYYYIQMQVYMKAFNLPYAVFIASNKNDDDVYVEIIEYNAVVAERMGVRADKIVHSPDAPMKMKGASAGFFKCKFCDFTKLCHLGRAPARNCRTCAFSQPTNELDENGKGIWKCLTLRKSLTKEEQVAGCDRYQMIKGL